MDFLRWLIRAIIVGLVTEWVHRTHANHANRQRPGELAPTSVHVGWATKLLGPIISLPLAALAAIVWASIFVGRPIDNAWFGAIFFSAIAIWLGLGSYDAFVRRIDWNETEVRFRNWNSDRTMAWRDIVGLEEKDYPERFRIVFRDETGFDIVETMRGSRHFLGIVRRRVDPDPKGGVGNKRRKRRQRKK